MEVKISAETQARIDANVKRIKEGLKGVHTNLEDKEMVGRVIRENLTDEEIGTLAGALFDLTEEKSTS